jgi:hypothetical protein
MNLLSNSLLVVLALLTVSLPCALVFLWSRFGGPRAIRIATRLGAVVLSQVTAVALVAASINDYGYFFKSWSELAAGVAQMSGLGSAPGSAITHGARRFATEPLAAGRIAAGPIVGGHISIRSEGSFSSPSQWSRRGRLESVMIEGAVSRLHSHAFVYLPPQYFQRRYQHIYFPAAEVFTGYPGIDQYLVSRMRYQAVLQRLISHHRARPMVLVMLRPSVTFPRDTECTDVPGGPLAETFFAADVPDQVSADYRVLPTGWGTVGDSTGGYCATKLAMLHPETFVAAAEMSGYFFALRDHTTGDLWGHSQVVRDLNDLRWRLLHLPPPPVSVLLATSPSERGPDGYLAAEQFVRLVRPPMSVDVMSVPHGGHNIATWTAELPSAMTWLSAHLPPPGVSPVYYAGPSNGDEGNTTTMTRRSHSG